MGLNLPVYDLNIRVLAISTSAVGANYMQPTYNEQRPKRNKAVAFLTDEVIACSTAIRAEVLMLSITQLMADDAT